MLTISSMALLQYLMVEGAHIWQNNCLWCVDYNEDIRSPI